jgi:predicted ATPase/DNA-binding SARP family transcriptional activator
LRPHGGPQGLLSAGVTGGISRFGVLGPLALERDGGPVTLPSGRQRTLLALLAFGGGVPLSRDRLIDELWGDRPPASAVSALHVHLSKLRALLGGVLVLEASGYALKAGGFELDVWRFDALVAQARASPERAVPLLGEALGLFRGEPLCDVDSDGSLAQWRRELEDKRLQALLLRLDAGLAAGAAGELVGELERLALAHPYEERVWGQLMLALYRAGRQAEALDAYQRARRLFAAELGLEPGLPLAELQQRILDRDPSLHPQVQPPAVRPRQGSSLPRPVTRLIGRERELASLAELMGDPDVRLVTVTGPGGVGKTRLLLELARSQEPDHADGAVFVRLERLTDPSLVAPEIALALARRDGTDGPSADTLATYLRDRDLLMVVDNFEHLLAAATLMGELLELAPRMRVIVSSRTALRIRGEHAFEVEPLGLPDDDSEAALSRSAAVRLFLQCAQAANRQLQIDLATTQTVAHICRALDGLPLAIELAASRSHSLSTEQIAEQLARPLLIGGHSLRDLPDRQQTLPATIRWSYDLLSPPSRQVLRGAAAFRGGFTTAALEAVAGRSVAPELDELREASLVRRQAGNRYELLELVRAFAFDELRTSEQATEAGLRHRRYFVSLVEPSRSEFDNGGAPGELAEPLRPDHANLRAAFENAYEADDHESALALALGMRPLWIAGMLRLESQELVERLLGHFSTPGETEVALLRAVAFLDYSPSARIWHQRLAARAVEIGDQEAVAIATGNLFGRALNGRDRDEMRRLRPALLALVTPETSDRALGWIQYFLALDAYVDERFQEAADRAALSMQRATRIGHEFMLGSAAGTGVLAQSARDGGIAHGDLAEAVELMRRPGIPPLAAFALWLVGRYAAGVAPETAGRWLAHAERILGSLDSQLWPESDLRDETLAVLGLHDLAPVLESTPPLDHNTALAQAAAWLAGREAGERSPRTPMPLAEASALPTT